MGRHHDRTWPANAHRACGLAGVERELIRARTGEGRARAKTRSVKMGRPPEITPHQVKEALNRRDAGEPMRDIAKSYNILHDTVRGVTTAVYADVPAYDVAGNLIANYVAALFDTATIPLRHPITLTQTGAATGAFSIWTGSAPDGTLPG